VAADPGIELLPASRFPPQRLAELFTAGYEGYQFPIRLDEDTFVAMADVSDLDLDCSRVALHGTIAAGLCVLGVRGRSGWIGGLGVVAAERRQGVGRELTEGVLTAAAGAALEHVSLEVLEGNAAAIALYERLGFRTTRILEVWSLEGPARPARADPVDPDHARSWIRAHRPGPEPWQRADESVDALVRRGAQLRALTLADDGAVVIRVEDDAVSVVQLVARAEDAAAQLIGAALSLGTTLRYVNVPESDPAASALRRLGGRLDVRQLEMSRPVR
jgi:ribosomal protein S18 acetylase RimI-like enzyme